MVKFRIGINKLYKEIALIKRHNLVEHPALLTKENDHSISISWTDGPAGVCSTIKAENVEYDGAVIFNPRSVWDALKPIRTNKSMVQVEVDNQSFSFKINGIEFAAPTRSGILAKSPYLRIGDQLEADAIINSSIIRKGLEKTLPFINQHDVRRYMRGICMRFEEDNLRMTGTDGVQLLEFNHPVNLDINPVEIILPYSTVKVLLDILKKHKDEQVFVGFMGRYISFSSSSLSDEGFLVCGEVIADTYPDYGPLFDDDPDTIVSIDTKSMTDTINTIAGSLDREDNNRMTIRTSPKNLIFENDLSKGMCKISDRFGKEIDDDVNGVFLKSLLSKLPPKPELQVEGRSGKNYLTFVSSGSDRALLTIVRRVVR